jgi:hypothetical protein
MLAGVPSRTRANNNAHQVWISGTTDHRLKAGDIVDRLVESAAKKAAAIAAAKREEAAAGFEPAK